MDTLLEALDSASAPDRTTFRPVFFRLSVPDDRVRLEELLKREPHTVVHDELHSQLRELVRSLNPSKRYTKEDLDIAAVAHLNGEDPRSYGVWVHYPWSGRLIHLLDEREFVLVRTDRNRNKITAEEQAVLATKRVGVIGLSVGQSVSLTMASERTFGEIRLADFDSLELSNLNRIRSGVHEMGSLKVWNTAREIAEMDPFLKITCFPEGISATNINDFLTTGGKLDLLIEECDSVAIKIMARQKAKALGIPVVMDTSDRGMVDVERFDLEPDRPILHGLVEHLDLDLAQQAQTNEQKLPFVLPIAGMDTLSPRMKASMLEIENTVTTWPQLASSVVMGGAVGGHIMRRIVLGHRIPSGRWWMDPDDIIGVPESAGSDVPDSVEPTVLTAQHTTLDEEGMHAATRRSSLRVGTDRLSREEAELLAQAGCHAPTGGNCQPWQFLHGDGRLFLFMDVDRARSALDPGLRYAYLGLGACLENMLLKARNLGITLRYDFLPLADVPQLVAVLDVQDRSPSTGPDKVDRRLSEFIAIRCTNRKNSEVMEMADEEAQALIDAVHSKIPQASITLVRDREAIDKIASLCGRAERIRFLNATCHHDMFVREMRWKKEDVEGTKDGIDIATLELSLADRTGLRVASDPKAMTLLRHWGTGKAIEKLASKGVRASSALGIISLPDLGIESAFEGGRAMQRFWLQAASMELLAHPVGAPIFMGIHGLWDKDGILSAEEHHEAGAILNQLAQIIGAGAAKPFFMLRLGRAGQPTARSLRLPLSEVFHTDLISVA